MKISGSIAQVIRSDGSQSPAWHLENRNRNRASQRFFKTCAKHLLACLRHQFQRRARKFTTITHMKQFGFALMVLSVALTLHFFNQTEDTQKKVDDAAASEIQEIIRSGSLHDEATLDRIDEVHRRSEISNQRSAQTTFSTSLLVSGAGILGFLGGLVLFVAGFRSKLRLADQGQPRQ